MNHYNEVAGVLETGAELVSPHLRWLIRNAILEHCGPAAVNLIAYNESVPAEHYGIAHAPSKSLVLNLEKHFYNAVIKVQEDENMYASLRTLILHELLDTAKHEAHHLLVAFEEGNFEDSDLDEEGAKVAGKLSWQVARDWDVNIVLFGTFLDTLIDDFIADVKEATLETPTMWKDLQVYMHENCLGYYNPYKDMELSIMNTFEALAKDDNPWMTEPAKFLDTTICETERTQVPTVPAVDGIDIPVDNYESQMPIHPQEVTPAGMSMFEALALVQNSGAQPIISQSTFERFMAQSLKEDGYVPPSLPAMGDSYPVYDGGDDYDWNEEPELAPVAPITPVMQPMTQTAPVAPVAQGAGGHGMAKVIETVFRTIFWHVVNKGEFTHEGSYNNPAVVMQPVSIAHIPGALDIFTNMDTLDKNGKYAKNQPCSMGITGMLTKEMLPKYTMFLNIAGTVHRRSLVAQNPNAVDGQGALKTWAKEARQGTKIMYVLGDEKNPGVRASIKLTAGSPLGQEEYKLWT